MGTWRVAIGRGLLVGSAATGTYTFRHALLSEAVHSILLPGEVSRLHSPLARMIEVDPALARSRTAARRPRSHIAWVSPQRKHRNDRNPGEAVSIPAARRRDSVTGGSVAWGPECARRSRVSVYGRSLNPTRRATVYLHNLLDSRRTIRDFSSRPVEDDDLTEVLWGAQGQTSDGRRTTPSAAGRYPLQLIIARGPQPAGTWTWSPQDQTLVPRGTHDVRATLAAAALGDQPWVLAAPVTVVLCADVGDMVSHFADQPPATRGRRYADIELGAAVQNLALSCTDRGLGGVIVGGFDDDLVAETLELDAHEPRLLFSLGHPA